MDSKDCQKNDSFFKEEKQSISVLPKISKDRNKNDDAVKNDNISESELDNILDQWETESRQIFKESKQEEKGGWLPPMIRVINPEKNDSELHRPHCNFGDICS